MKCSISWPQANWLGRPRSEVITYPDGVPRILTMPERRWLAFERLRAEGWDFCDVLKCAVDMVEDTPEPVYNDELLHATEFVILIGTRVADGLEIHANDNSPLRISP